MGKNSFVLFFRLLAFLPWLERDRTIRAVGTGHLAQDAVADDGVEHLDARSFHQNLFDPFAHRIQALERCRLWQLNVKVKISLVLFWKKSSRKLCSEQNNHSHDHDQK